MSPKIASYFSSLYSKHGIFGSYGNTFLQRKSYKKAPRRLLHFFRIAIAATCRYLQQLVVAAAATYHQHHGRIGTNIMDIFPHELCAEGSARAQNNTFE